MTAPDGTGRYNHFENGSIYWTPNTGAHAVAGAIREKMGRSRLGAELTGLSITDELTISLHTAGVVRFNKFQSGAIRISPTGNVNVISEVWTEFPFRHFC
ncbi:MAG: hypothetical protein IPM55_22915 [Acidobacteria bacterium]|nr:hypothetical protein [Acidobacteriota bacterium]